MELLPTVGAGIGVDDADAQLAVSIVAGSIDAHGETTLVPGLGNHGLKQDMLLAGSHGHDILHLAGGGLILVARDSYGDHHAAAGHHAQLAPAVAAPGPGGAVGQDRSGIISVGTDGDHVLQIRIMAGADALKHLGGRIAGGGSLIGLIVHGDQTLGVVIAGIAHAKLTVCVVAEGPHIAVFIQEQGVVGAGGYGHDFSGDLILGKGSVLRIVSRGIGVGRSGLLPGQKVLHQIGGMEGLGKTGIPEQLAADGLVVIAVILVHNILIVNVGALINTGLTVGVIAPGPDGSAAVIFLLQRHKVIVTGSYLNNVVPEERRGGFALHQLVLFIAVSAVTPGPERAVRLQGDGGGLAGDHHGGRHPVARGNGSVRGILLGALDLHDEKAHHIALGVHSGHGNIADLLEAGVAQVGGAHPPLAGGGILIDLQDTLVAGKELDAGITLTQLFRACNRIVGQQVKAEVFGQVYRILNGDIRIFVDLPERADPVEARGGVGQIAAEVELQHLGRLLAGIEGLIPPVIGQVIRTAGRQAQLALGVIAEGEHVAGAGDQNAVIAACSRHHDALGISAGSLGLSVHHHYDAVIVCLTIRKLAAGVVAPGEDTAVRQADQSVRLAGIHRHGQSSIKVIVQPAFGQAKDPHGSAGEFHGPVDQIAFFIQDLCTELALGVIAPGKNALCLRKVIIIACKLAGDHRHMAAARRDGVDAGKHAKDGLVVYVIVTADHLDGRGAVVHPAAIAQLAVSIVAPGEHGAVGEQGHRVALTGLHVHYVLQNALGLKAQHLDCGAQLLQAVLAQLAVVVGAGSPDSAVLAQRQHMIGAGGNIDDVSDGSLHGQAVHIHRAGIVGQDLALGNRLSAALIIRHSPDMVVLAAAPVPMLPLILRQGFPAHAGHMSGPNVMVVCVKLVEVALSHNGTAFHRTAQGSHLVQRIIDAQATAHFALQRALEVLIVSLAPGTDIVLPRGPLLHHDSIIEGQAVGIGVSLKVRRNIVGHFGVGINICRGQVHHRGGAVDKVVVLITNLRTGLFVNGVPLTFIGQSLGHDHRRLPDRMVLDHVAFGAADGADLGDIQPNAAVVPQRVHIAVRSIVLGAVAVRLLLFGGNGHPAQIVLGDFAGVNVLLRGVRHSLAVGVMPLEVHGQRTVGSAQNILSGQGVDLLLGINTVNGSFSAAAAAHIIYGVLLIPRGQLGLQLLLLRGSVDQVGGDAGQHAHHNDLPLIGKQKTIVVAGSHSTDLCIGIAFRVHHLNGISAIFKGIVTQLSAAVVAPGPDGTVRAEGHSMPGAHRNLRRGGEVLAGTLCLLDLDPQQGHTSGSRMIDLDHGLAIAPVGRIGRGTLEDHSAVHLALLLDQRGIQRPEEQIAALDLLGRNMLEQIEALVP